MAYSKKTGDEVISEAKRRENSRETYEAVLRIIDYQTTEMQSALVARSTIRQIIARSNLDLEQGDKAIRRAIECGDVVTFNGRLALGTEDSLIRIIEDEAASDYPRKQLIAACNKRLQAIRDDDDA